MSDHRFGEYCIIGDEGPVVVGRRTWFDSYPEASDHGRQLQINNIKAGLPPPTLYVMRKAGTLDGVTASLGLRDRRAQIFEAKACRLHWQLVNHGQMGT